MNKRQSLPFALLLATFLIWLFFKQEAVLPSLPVHHPSYIATDIKSTHFNKTGFLDHKIFADKATNFNEDELTNFENPKVIVYTHNEQTDTTTVWQMTSAEGALYRQNKLVLSKNVLVKNLSLDQLVQTIKTEQLTLLLDKQEFSSDLLVTWEGPQIHQQGVGIWASLVTEEVIIKDQIKAVYFNENK
ncbi:LPS export ABC transporter periplasmic protein LptC [Psychromonas sp. MB-3u-54]|uniref:LPS export ABC transporter periplasmic protein LptC n=1 Tax=Psychromonas sp. MB-3u-54 TaxID=2058319 RepID=UPI000C31F65F|nr:LPS export ABC transporter periplasmic protein LptC [Psychromonas sp. MB-3u-54]PKH01893.1 LPS export ABC transporter periplasmic protein LptC [Psychromonas sp. MB-3u-54]